MKSYFIFYFVKFLINFAFFQLFVSKHL